MNQVQCGIFSYAYQLNDQTVSGSLVGSLISRKHCQQLGKQSFRFHLLEDICVWLFSFNIMSSSSIPLAANEGVSFLFLDDENSIVHMCILYAFIC